MNLAVTKRCRHVFDVCPIHVAGLVAPLLGKTEVLLLLLRLILNIVEGIHIRGLARESAVVGCVDISRGRSARVDERPSEQASTGVRLHIGDSSISNWVGVVPGYQRLAAGRPGISESVGGWTDDGPVRTASTRPGLFRPSRFEYMHKLIYCRPRRRGHDCREHHGGTGDYRQDASRHRPDTLRRERHDDDRHRTPTDLPRTGRIPALPARRTVLTRSLTVSRRPFRSTIVRQALHSRIGFPQPWLWDADSRCRLRTQ